MASSSSSAPSGVHRAFRVVVDGTKNLAGELVSDSVHMKTIAQHLERHNQGSSEVKAMDAAVLELLDAANKVDQFKQSVEAVSASYAPSDQPTDFRKLIEAESRSRPTPPATEHSFYKQFQEAVWNVHHSGIPMPGQEQADVLITTQVGLLNKTCPLSGKPVIELSDPVRSTVCRHVYEREVVMRYIGSRRQCAAAGCPKQLTPQDFVCDASLLMEIEELRGAGANRAPNVNYTELDEDE